MRNPTVPVLCYVGAVLGVIAVASLAAFQLQGISARAHRHWDADIDRIIAQQLEKKREAEVAMLARAGDDGREDEPQVAAFTTRAALDDEDDDADAEQSRPRKNPSHGERKSSRRGGGERKGQQHFIPSAFATLPKFAASAAATTTTLLRLR
jgi:hypothetical protein